MDEVTRERLRLTRAVRNSVDFENVDLVGECAKASLQIGVWFAVQLELPSETSMLLACLSFASRDLTVFSNVLVYLPFLRWTCWQLRFWFLFPLCFGFLLGEWVPEKNSERFYHVIFNQVICFDSTSWKVFQGKKRHCWLVKPISNLIPWMSTHSTYHNCKSPRKKVRILSTHENRSLRSLMIDRRSKSGIGAFDRSAITISINSPLAPCPCSHSNSMIHLGRVGGIQWVLGS